jgi:hypothetical protein
VSVSHQVRILHGDIPDRPFDRSIFMNIEAKPQSAIAGIGLNVPRPHKFLSRSFYGPPYAGIFQSKKYNRGDQHQGDDDSQGEDYCLFHGSTPCCIGWGYLGLSNENPHPVRDQSAFASLKESAERDQAAAREEQSLNRVNGFDQHGDTTDK